VTPVPPDDHVLFARCDELDELWAAWAVQLRSMTPDAWALPTRLPGWSVDALVAHHSMFPASGVPSMLRRRTDGPPTIPSAVHMLRRFNQPDGAATRLAPKVEEQARGMADAMPVDALVRRFTDDAPATIAAVRAAGPIVVDYFGHGDLALSEALRLGILEATVHLLDLQRALAVPLAIPPAGLHTTVVLLAEVAPEIDFVEAATGRTSAATLPLPVIR
jgi:uncharacterized protein (TIGR03083 family)